MEYSNYFSSISEDMHLDINEELLFLRQATVGDIKAIEKNIKDRMFRKTIRTGTLSKDPLTNIKYHMVITAALLSRFCIANGMAPEAAFKMSDFYIQKLDKNFFLRLLVNVYLLEMILLFLKNYLDI